MKRAAFVLFIVVAGAGDRLSRSAPEAPPRLHAGARPNIVLITIDTLRADRVGRGLTPAIDALAARGVRFTNVRTTAPLTLPSHTSLMTGLIPPLHGVRENGVVFDRKTPTLARLLKDAGYRTGAFVGAYVLNRRFGLDEGFDVYDDAVKRDMERAEQLEAERPGAEVVDAALKWLPPVDRRRGAFLRLDPPLRPARTLHAAGGVSRQGRRQFLRRGSRLCGRAGRPSDGGASEPQLADRTVIVVTGDHGEALGEHGEQTHGMLVYDATLRVPLTVSLPWIGVGAGLKRGPTIIRDR